MPRPPSYARVRRCQLDAPACVWCHLDRHAALTAARETEIMPTIDLRSERRVGSVHRQFTLPAGVDSQSATAQLKDGVLTLTMPKAAGATPQRIEVG